jgi:type I restriction enzyme, S subunit
MPGDLLMAMTRPIVSGGIKITRLRNEDCPCLLNQRVARFNISLSINKEYLFQVLFNPYFINAIGLGALGSQQPNISATQIEQIRIPFTDLDEQKEIADILKSVDKKIELHASKKIALQDMFKTMLTKLMTGKIRVKDSDIDTSCVLEMENRG